MPIVGRTNYENTWAEGSINLGALSERVSGAERNFLTLSDKIDDVQKDFSSQMHGMAESISESIKDIVTKIETQSAAWNSARSTNWLAFWATAAGVAIVVIGLIAAILKPINDDLRQVVSDFKDFSRVAVTSDTFNSEIKLMRERINRDETRATQLEDKHDAEMLAAAQDRIKSLELELQVRRGASPAEVPDHVSK
jgi:hypothetical protein